MITFVSLLFIDTARFRESANTSFGTPARKLTGYVLQAIQLHNSLKKNLYSGLILLTNEPDLVQSIFDKLNVNDGPRVYVLNAQSKVPLDVGFYEAHFKLDVIRQIGAGDLEATAHDYYILLDLDIVCLKRISDSLSALIKCGQSIAFDISDQVFPAYGLATIASDVNKLAGRQLDYSMIRWYGGEFLGGSRDFFLTISDAATNVLARYVDCYSVLHHQGDEAIISGAIAELKARGSFGIVDVGAMDVVARFWSARTRHVQKPLLHALRADFLHLPSSKKLLERRAKKEKVGGALRLLVFREAIYQSLTWWRQLIGHW